MRGGVLLAEEKRKVMWRRGKEKEERGQAETRRQQRAKGDTEKVIQEGKSDLHIPLRVTDRRQTADET